MVLRRFAALSLCSLAGAACASGGGSRLAGAGRYGRWEGAVGMSALQAPAGAESLGEITAEGSEDIETLVENLVTQARNGGGNFVAIESIRPRVEWQNRPYTQTFNCGSYRFPASCSRTLYQYEEVAVVSLRAVAYRVGGAGR